MRRKYIAMAEYPIMSHIPLNIANSYETFNSTDYLDIKECIIVLNILVF